MKNTIVVVGGGVAGLSAAQAARKQDGEARILLYHAEPYLPYYRPRVPQLIIGEADPDKIAVKTEQFYRDQNIELIQSPVLAVEDGEVVAGDGSREAYTTLVLATGGESFFPGNIEPEGPVQGLRTVADAYKLQERLCVGDPVIVVGGGLLGLEAATYLKRAGMKVTVLEGESGLLNRQLDEDGSRRLEEEAENFGIAVRLNARVSAVEGHAILLEDGEKLEGAALLFSIGMRANTELARKMGLAVNRAVVVNSAMETSKAGVYAAGDAAEVDGRNYGLFNISMEQGAVAGTNAAGGKAVWQPPVIPYVMQALGVQTFAMGELTGERVQKEDAKGYRALYHREGRIVGAVWVGEKCPMALLRKAVSQNASLAEIQL
ncbi:NAD(P)/FAD-dependent oxidoreductase [Gehongia tenuis]|uniref:NAD(P)/FAD-dependent oxidoreductase n=1 Tax=Gehongia tenuis TaxID=2763655 RepID=A0A926HLF2_9FIRM|nr:FAD-dependent oxidoreductase [Gehongia tenuis]MBC8532007.1 NAD(P)/FAD-dependent oxidoreductase [Gehongia tenuis]